MAITFTPALCYFLAFFAVFIATASQILLKKQANSTLGKTGFIWKFLNLRVIIAYSTLLLSMALNQIALRHVPVAVMPCINSTSFIWIFLFGFFVLKETPSRKKIIGVVLIVLGIAISRL